MACRVSYFHLGTALISGALGLPLACNTPSAGGQTGDGSGVIDPVESNTADAPIHCEREEREVTLGEQTPLGFSAGEVLAFAQGSFASEIAWSDEAGSEEGRNGPAADFRSGVTIVVSHRKEKPATYAEPKSVDAGVVAPDCDPVVRIPVTVTLKTDDGTLNERFETQLLASSTDVATFEGRLLAKDLRGDLAALTASRAVQSLRISGFVSPNGSAGTIELTADLADAGPMETPVEPEPDSPIGPVFVAHTFLTGRWPAEACLGGPTRVDSPSIAVDPDTALSGVNFDELLGRVAAEAALPVRWHDGSETEMTLSMASSGTVCMVVGFDYVSQRADLRGLVAVKVATRDKTLVGSLNGTFQARPDAEGLASAQLEANFSASPTTFSKLVAVKGVALADYETVALSLQLFVQPGNTSPQGWLTLHGLDSSCKQDEIVFGCGQLLLQAELGVPYTVTPAER